MKSINKNKSATGFQRYLAGMALVIATAVSLSAPVTAQAADAKTYSGNGCQGTNSVYNDRLAKDYNGLRNTSAQYYTWVTCPITRDNTTNTSGNDRSYVYVNQYSGTSQRFLCYLSSRSAWGAQSDFTWRQLGSTQNGNQYMYLDLDSSYNWGTYELRCRIPPRSKLYSIYFKEH